MSLWVLRDQEETMNCGCHVRLSVRWLVADTSQSQCNPAAVWNPQTSIPRRHHKGQKCGQDSLVAFGGGQRCMHHCFSPPNPLCATSSSVRGSVRFLVAEISDASSEHQGRPSSLLYSNSPIPHHSVAFCEYVFSCLLGWKILKAGFMRVLLKIAGAR